MYTRIDRLFVCLDASSDAGLFIILVQVLKKKNELGLVWRFD